jgi:acyl-CoA synthetase (NDP forming)
VLFHSLLAGAFRGPVYPVNPASPSVHAVAAYPSIAAVPEVVDLAILAVPAEQVLGVAEACVTRGVRALLVLSAGFGEVDASGRERQRELVRLCRAHGARLIGPNCLGIVNTDDNVALNATFGPLAPRRGRLAFGSQSGALGLAMVGHGARLGLGISSFVSMGNKADISGNDLLSYWEHDPRSRVILLYLESFGNPRKFARIARRVSRSKPIVAVKSGRSIAGARAAASHTGALLAAGDVPVEALFRQAGVIRTTTLEELFDVAALLARQPLPPGRRVGIVTNAGGPAILCADACEAHGLQLPVLAEATQARLRSVLPAAASVVNPVDMVAAATPEQFREVLPIVGSDPSVDAVVTIFLEPLRGRGTGIGEAIAAGVEAIDVSKPAMVVFMSADGALPEIEARGSPLPAYPFPEAAALALSHAARHVEWLRQPQEPPARLPGIRRAEAAAILAKALERGATWLEPDEIAALCGCYGLPLVEQRLVATPAEAAHAAAELGLTVALKAVSPGLVHKTELGAVQLNLEQPREVQGAAERMAAALARNGLDPPRFLVQRMAPPGVELLLGLVHDRDFGPLLACGAGGTTAELQADVAVRLTPLAGRDASEMLRELRSYPLLSGYRGQPPLDVPAVEETLLRLSSLADDLPQIAELDFNPLIVHERGASIADARVRVAPA